VSDVHGRYSCRPIPAQVWLCEHSCRACSSQQQPVVALRSKAWDWQMRANGTGDARGSARRQPGPSCSCGLAFSLFSARRHRPGAPRCASGARRTGARAWAPSRSGPARPSCGGRDGGRGRSAGRSRACVRDPEFENAHFGDTRGGSCLPTHMPFRKRLRMTCRAGLDPAAVAAAQRTGASSLALASTRQRAQACGSVTDRRVPARTRCGVAGRRLARRASARS